MLKLNLNHESDDALLVRTAWIYHVAGLTQEETAARLGLHRTRVTRLLSEARDRGIVSITIQHEATRDLEKEDAIVRAYGLDFCLSTPAIGYKNHPVTEPMAIQMQGEVARRAVGSAAASFLNGKLAGGPVTVGVGWGRTIEQVALHLPVVRNPEAKFVSLMGSLTRNSASNPFEVVQAFAARTGGEGHFLPMPFIADTEADRSVLISQRTVLDALKLARSADLYLISVGELDEGAFLRRENMLSAKELATVRAHGAVCDTLGQFFDAKGKIVRHELSQRTLAIDVKHLRGRNVVLLGAGLHKVPALNALLRSGLVRGLIIDGDAAGELAQLTTRR